MIKLFLGFMMGALFGIVITLFSVEKYYNFRQKHDDLFSGKTVQELKDSGCELWSESKERVLETYKHSKASVKGWLG